MDTVLLTFEVAMDAAVKAGVCGGGRCLSVECLVLWSGGHR